MTATGGRLVLVVEDDSSMREAIARFLNAAGLPTRVYASAEALLSAGPVPEAACLVTDFKLPVMSGLDLLTEVAARGGWPPAVLITAHDTRGLREEAMQRGAVGYLPKPFAGAELLALINTVPDGPPGTHAC